MFCSYYCCDWNICQEKMENLLKWRWTLIRFSVEVAVVITIKYVFERFNFQQGRYHHKYIFKHYKRNIHNQRMFLVEILVAAVAIVVVIVITFYKNSFIEYIKVFVIIVVSTFRIIAIIKIFYLYQINFLQLKLTLSSWSLKLSSFLIDFRPLFPLPFIGIFVFIVDGK